MFLVHVELRGKFTNRYELHRALWPAFKYARPTGRPFVFQVVDAARDCTLVILVSEIHPRETPLARVTRIQQIALVDLPLARVLSFTLLAAPTRCLTANGSGMRGRHVAITGRDEQLEWLRLKLNGAAELKAAEVVETRRIRFVKKGKGGSFLEVLYRGECVIHNAAKFSSVLVHGIGRQKAFGLGLLNVFEDLQPLLETIHSSDASSA